MRDGSYDPTPIGRILDDQTKRFGMGASKDVGALFASWESIVGPAVSAHVEPASLRNGVLKLRADSPTWATEIGYLREEIRAQANEALGRPIIQSIEVGIGPRKGDGQARAGSKTEPDRGSRTPSERPPADDPMTAFERARAAWLRRRSRAR